MSYVEEDELKTAVILHNLGASGKLVDAAYLIGNSVLKKYKFRRSDREDYQQELAWAIVQAADTYDENKGNSYRYLYAAAEQRLWILMKRERRHRVRIRRYMVNLKHPGALQDGDAEAKPRTRGRMPSVEAIQHFRVQGWSHRRIAEHFQVSPRSIGRILQNSVKGGESTLQ